MDGADYFMRFITFGAYSETFPKGSGAVVHSPYLPSDIQHSLQAAFFTDACPYVSTSGVWESTLVPRFSSAACYAVSSGVVGRGMIGAVKAEVCSPISSPLVKKLFYDRSLLHLQIEFGQSICALRGQTNIPNASGLGYTTSGAAYSVYEVLNSADMTNGE